MELKTEIGVPWLIIMGVVVMLLLALTVVVFVLVYNGKLLRQQNRMQEIQVDHRKQLMEAIIQAQEKERQAMAHNIHDDIGSLLNAVKLNLGSVTLDKNEETRNETVNHLVRSVQTGIDQLRNLTKELLPPVLEKYGLKSALDELVSRINLSKQVKAEISFFETITFKKSFVELQVYRMVQEILNNILKHGGASEIYLSGKRSENDYTIMIEHNGTGLSNEEVDDISQRSTGLGLKSIMSRALVIGSTVSYKNHSPRPSVTIIIPNVHE